MLILNYLRRKTCVLNNIIKVLALFGYVLLIYLPNNTCKAEEKKEVEFAHFWVSRGEANSLKILSDQFTSLGGEWSEVSSEDYEIMKRDIVVRIAAGYPPTAFWLGGEDIASMTQLNILTNLSSLIREDQWSKPIHSFIMEKATINGKIMALPITVHNENWAWFNRNIYKKLHLTLPKNWDDFLSQAPIIKKAGYLPLAISDQDWNSRILFTTILAGTGEELYKGFYIQNRPSILDNPKIIRALKILGELRQYRPQKGIMKNWTQATLSVINEKAAMQIMGDWVKGEFEILGEEYSKKLACLPVPEAENYFIAAVDFIGFPVVQNQYENEGQQLFAKIILEKESQIQFAKLKGSIPVRTDITLNDIDACSSISFPKLFKNSSLLLSPRLIMDEHKRVEVQNAIAAFWNTDSMSVIQVSENIKKIFSDK